MTNNGIGENANAVAEATKFVSIFQTKRTFLTAIVFTLISIINIYEYSVLPSIFGKTAAENNTSIILSHTNNELTEDHPQPFSFSACLKLKDVNSLLPEWLAYHYTVLPLRRLIVAVDPMSHTDPAPILNSYRSIGMNITIWSEEALYWKDGNGRIHEKLKFVVPDKKDESDYKRTLYL